MKINLDQALINLDGTASLEKKEDGSVQTLTAKSIVLVSLNTFKPNTSISPEEMTSRGNLIKKIRTGADDFSIDEVSLMKKCVEVTTYPFTFIQVCDILEQKTEA